MGHKSLVLFVMVSVGKFYTDHAQYGVEIFQAQYDVCQGDPNALFVDAVKYGWQVNSESPYAPNICENDPVHYSTVGQVEGGRDLYAEVMAVFGAELIQNPEQESGVEP